MGDCRNGFVFIEILITLAIFTILVVCIKSGVYSMHRVLVKAELEHIFTIALYLQRKAMTTGVEQSIVFDTSTQSFAFEDTQCRLPKGVCFGIVPDVKGPPSWQIKTPKSITFSCNKITFYPSGAIQPGSVYVCDTKKEHMYALTIPVSYISLIRLYRYDDGWQRMK
jgi:prepilin-type N-terminal cleavage/methylation domain-containing protein